jgi:hypothetical protein
MIHVRTAMPLVLLATMLSFAPAVNGAEVKLGANDSVQQVLAAQKGARITVRLRSGQEFAGIVREVNSRVLQLGTLGGKEFFDAVISLDAVEAVFFRTDGK